MTKRTYLQLYGGGTVEASWSILARCGIQPDDKLATLTHEQRRALGAACKAAKVAAPEFSTISNEGYFFNLLRAGFTR